MAPEKIFGKCILEIQFAETHIYCTVSYIERIRWNKNQKPPSKQPQAPKIFMLLYKFAHSLMRIPLTALTSILAAEGIHPQTQ